MIPTVRIPEVHHVGSLMPASRTSRSSLEAFMLSVSVNPEEWSSIARCAGPVWTLTLEAAEYLDVMALDDATRAEAEAWALREGYAEKGQVWRAWRFDDESDGWAYMDCASEGEAEREAEEEGSFDPDEIPSKSGFAIDRIDAVLLTDAGMAALERWHSKTNAQDGVLILWARLALAPHNPDLVGVWWEEDMDPEGLSCPRGGVFPDRLPHFSIVDEHGNAPPSDFLKLLAEDSDLSLQF